MTDTLSTGVISASALTVAELFKTQALATPHRIAIEEGGRHWTYRELNARVGRLARSLAARGVVRASRIAVLAENRHEYIEVILAAAQLGAMVACLNWRLSDDELAACQRLARPGFAFASERHMARLNATGDPSVVPIAFGKEFERLLEGETDTAPLALADAEDGLTLLYTSGTTGRAKGAMISQRALVARAAILALDGILPRGMSFVAWAPMFHIGANDSSIATLMGGGKVIIIDGFKPEAIAQAVMANEIGWLSLAGTVGRMVEELRKHTVPPGQVRLVGSMADLVPRAEIMAVSALLQAPFLNSFASTETGMAPASAGVLAVGALPEKFLKRQSSLCSIRLLDPQGREVAEGEAGLLAMRGPSLFSGYFGDTEATEDAFHDGWYKTGDMFVRHPDGLLEFAGRDKYLIKSGGENIYPAEIEQLVLASTRVQDAVLMGKPDDRWGEIPVLLVVRSDPALTATDVAALYAGRVAGYKIPKEIRFVEPGFLARSSTGKVIRSMIRL